MKEAAPKNLEGLRQRNYYQHEKEILPKVNFSLKEHGSQGEKKTFKYLLKIIEGEIIIKEKKTHPIILLDDFFAKLDAENIMKIFTYFHCKFQTIITTTKPNKEILKIAKNNKENITIISLND